MSAVPLLLVLAAAAIHAGWNRILHDVDDRLAALAVAGCAGAIVLLPAIVRSPPRNVLPLVVLSALTEVAYAVCLAAAYRRGALSVAYPIGRGTAPLLVSLGSWVVLGERLQPAGVAGALMLGIGLVIIGVAGQRVHGWQAVGFAVLTGCCIATYSLIDARAVQHASPPAYLGVVLGLQGALLIAGLRDRQLHLRRALRPGLVIGAGTVTAYLLVLFAFQQANAGRVATLRESSVLLALLMARERVGIRTWFGGVLVVAGAALAAA